MAIIPASSYPGKTITGDSGFPLGKARNITVPSDGTGTPWEQALVNDIFGFQQALLFGAGLSPSGVPDEVGASQYLDACRELFGMTFSAIANMVATDSSGISTNTLITVVRDTEFAFFQVKSGTVTGDGIRLFPFADDPNKFAERLDRGYVFDWRGSFSPLFGVDDGRFFLDTGYSATPPAAADYRFPVGARLVGVVFSNTGVADISGLAMYADSSPTTAAPTTLEFQLTPKVDVMSGDVRYIPVIDGGPDLNSAMALAFTAREIDATTTVVIQFIFELADGAGASVTDEVRRGDTLAPIEAAGAVDLVNRIADHNYPVALQRFDITERNQVVGKDLLIGGQRNLQRFTEDPINAVWFTMNSASAAVDNANTTYIDVDGARVKLTRILDTSAITTFASEYTIIPGAPLLSPAVFYIMSFYVMSATEEECRFHMRVLPSLSTAPGHGQRVATPRPRRVWGLVQAGAGSNVYAGDDPTASYNSGIIRDVVWFQANLAALIGDMSDMFVGGFQFEAVDPDLDTLVALDGICMIGDEFIAGIDTYPAFSNAIRTAGNPDAVESVQISRWIETELNARVFNRGIEGDLFADMHARWAADIETIAGTDEHARYIIIQGGALDLVAGFDAGDSAATVLAALKQGIFNLRNEAIFSSLIPVYLTIPPHPGIYGARNDTRQDYNKWLMSKYPLVVDINQVLESSDGQSIVREPGYTTDGYNLGPEGKKAVGQFIARQQFWNLPTPTPYQVATGSSDPVDAIVSLNGVKVYVGSGSPEGVVVAARGSRYWNDLPTGASDDEYVKISGTGNTGWAAT